MKDKISLTGDRPTGALHLGHYVGSLRRRTELQHTHQQFIMVADLQGLTSNYDRADFIRNNIHQVVEDYLSVGIDPQQNTIFVQSAIPALHEIGWHYMNLVTIALKLCILPFHSWFHTAFHRIRLCYWFTT